MARPLSGLGSHHVHDWGWFIDVDGRLAERNTFRRGQGAFTRTAPKGVVCNACNNGWMNRLEKRAIPILLPMAKGDSPSLTASQVHILNHWTAKTAVVAELMDEGGKAVNFFLTGLLKDMTPGDDSPQGFFTWIKPVEPYEGTHVRSSIFALEYADHVCTGHFIRAATIILGAVALVGVYSADPRAAGVMMDSDPWVYMGEPAWNGRDGWSLDRSAALTVEQALSLNDVIGRIFGGSRRVSLAGREAPTP